MKRIAMALLTLGATLTCSGSDVVACKAPDDCNGMPSYYLLSRLSTGGLQVKDANQQTVTSEFITLHDPVNELSITIQRWTSDWCIRDITETPFRAYLRRRPYRNDSTIVHNGDLYNPVCAIVRKGAQHIPGHYAVEFDVCEE